MCMSCGYSMEWAVLCGDSGLSWRDHVGSKYLVVLMSSNDDMEWKILSSQSLPRWTAMGYDG